MPIHWKREVVPLERVRRDALSVPRGSAPIMVAFWIALEHRLISMEERICVVFSFI